MTFKRVHLFIFLGHVGSTWPCQTSAERFQLTFISLYVDKLWPTKQYPNLHFKIIFLPLIYCSFHGNAGDEGFVKCNTEPKLVYLKNIQVKCAGKFRCKAEKKTEKPKQSSPCVGRPFGGKWFFLKS